MTTRDPDRIVMVLTFWICFAIGLVVSVAIFQTLLAGEIPSFRMVMIVVAMAMMCKLVKPKEAP